MATLDSSIVNIALPTLTQALHADLGRVKWVVILYLLTITCMLLPFGRLSDLLGRKRVFHCGYLVFTLGSLLCAFSPGLPLLIIARFVQALGASMLMANGPAIITAAFTSNDRGAALGTLSMVVSAGLIAGPGLGGMLIGLFGWRSIFLVNIPIGIFGMALVQKFINDDPKSMKRLSFDWLGGVLQSLLLFSVILFFEPPTLSSLKLLSIQIPHIYLGILVVTFLLAFVQVERRSSAPLFDLSLLKVQTFWAGNLAALLTFVSFSAITVLMPFFLEQSMGLPTHQAGILMTAIPLTILIVAPLSGRLSDRLGGRELSVAGSLVGSATLVAMSGGFGFGIHPAMSTQWIALGLAGIGLAIGLFQAPNNNSIMGSVPLNKIGVASAFLATIRNLGLVIGTSLATGVFSWRMSVTHGDFMHSIHFSYRMAALVACLATIAALSKKKE